jgi:hypothetical protein
MMDVISNSSFAMGDVFNVCQIGADRQCLGEERRLLIEQSKAIEKEKLGEKCVWSCRRN